MGRIQSWRGQHRRAVEQLEGFLAEYPNDPEGVALLAQALDWMGRPDRAGKVLRDHLALTPGDKSAERLLEELERSQRPETIFNYRESHQDDNLRITGWELGQDFQFNDGLTTVGPRFHTYRYDPKRNNGPAVSSDIFVYRPGLHVRHRFNDAIEWNGTGWVDVIDEKNGDNTSAPFTYDTWLTLWPNDFFRIDVGSNRTTFDNESSLRQNIKGTFATGSVDMMPDEKTRITGRFRWGDYTDTNNQTWWQAEVERRAPWAHPRTYFAARYTGMDFRKTLNNGYFDPDDYHSGEGRTASTTNCSRSCGITSKSAQAMRTRRAQRPGHLECRGRLQLLDQRLAGGRSALRLLQLQDRIGWRFERRIRPRNRQPHAAHALVVALLTHRQSHG